MCEVLKELRLDEPERDLFATPHNSKCKEFFGEEQDALQQSWEGKLNWCNPPFSLLDQVVDKVIKERPAVVVVVPDWQRLPWFQRLRQVAERQTYRACGVRVFELDGKPVNPTRWGTYFFYIPPRDDVPTVKVQTVQGLHTNLRIPVRVLGEGSVKRMSALIDTGAEICLVRKGLVEPHQLRPAERPLKLKTASGQSLGGGQLEVLLVFEMLAKDEQTGKEIIVRLPTWCYEADIKEDLILSYAWCQHRGMEVVAPMHGLRCRRNGRSAWIPGSQWELNENMVSQVSTRIEEGQWSLCLGTTNDEVHALRKAGYKVLTVGIRGEEPDVNLPVEDWNYWFFNPGEFVAVYAQVCARSPAQMANQAQRVRKVLDIIDYFKPQRWVLQIPLSQLNENLGFLEEFPSVVIDLCQFGVPKAGTKCWGSQVAGLPDVRCSRLTCQWGKQEHLKVARTAGRWRSKLSADMVRYVLRGNEEGMVQQIQSDVEARKLYQELKGKENLDKVVLLREPQDHELAVQQRAEILKRFAETALSGKYVPDPPKRGPFGEGIISLAAGAVPVSKPSYRIGGDRREAHKKLVEEVVKAGKVEEGRGVWNLPSFIVPKKEPGKFRLVQDFRPLNEVTLKDGHPLPRIADILQQQAKFRMWSKLDLVDGYHQMPLSAESKPLTCMSTPLGTMQWKVMSMGLKNAGSQFQHMMEWVLRDCREFATPYLDDVLIGSRGETMEELIENHDRDVVKVLEVFEKEQLICHPKKSSLFHMEVEFCGHILREGTRRPAPGKLLPIQN